MSTQSFSARHSRLAVALLASVLVAGCASVQPPSAPPAAPSQVASASPSPSSTESPPAQAIAWVEPAAYTFTFESSCGERSLIGRFRVTVEQFRTVAFQGLDEAGRRYQGDPRSMPTLSTLVKEAEAAKARGASRAEVTTDPADGHPVDVIIDMDANMIDEESCYRILDYVPSG
jgi:hypothetical protein